MGVVVSVHEVVMYVAACSEFGCHWNSEITGRVQAKALAEAHRNEHIEKYRAEQQAIDLKNEECFTCGGKLRWVDDAYICTKCGDEFYPEEESTTKEDR